MIVNSFNSFFFDIGEKLANSIPQFGKSALEYLQNYMPPVNSEFTFRKISITDVMKLLSELSENKATGLDNYQSKPLKISAGSIAPSLTNIFNRSLSTG